MSLGIEEYCPAVEPTNIFELLPRATIEQLMRGFFHRVKKGAALLWSEYDADKKIWIVQDDRVDALKYEKEDNKELFNRVCWRLREEDGERFLLESTQQILDYLGE